MPFDPIALDHTFTAPIGVTVKGEVWACVEMPGSAEFFGTGRSVRVGLTVDDIRNATEGELVVPAEVPEMQL